MSHVQDTLFQRASESGGVMTLTATWHGKES